VTGHFHELGPEGAPWPLWIRKQRGRCGVYAIKERGRIVYVGSSRKRLYDTITRHFQRWHRAKKFWKGLRGAGHDPGMTYDRSICSVAIVTCACGDERTLEAHWIAKYSPRDNLTEHPDGEAAPF